MRLSVVIPVYNERHTIMEIIHRVKAVEPSDKEVIIVDDCSSDGTRDILAGIRESGIKVVFHDKNSGKGAAIRTGSARRSRMIPRRRTEEILRPVSFPPANWQSFSTSAVRPAGRGAAFPASVSWLWRLTLAASRNRSS